MVLDSDTEEHLLRDIERKGLPLAQVSLVDICDADPAVYGRSGKPRRPVQQRWGKIKRLKPRGYLALLKKYKIPPSPATLAEGEEGKESNEPEPTETIIDDDNEDTIKDDDEGTIHLTTTRKPSLTTTTTSKPSLTTTTSQLPTIVFPTSHPHLQASRSSRLGCSTPQRGLRFWGRGRRFHQ